MLYKETVSPGQDKRETREIFKTILALNVESGEDINEAKKLEGGIRERVAARDSRVISG